MINKREIDKLGQLLADIAALEAKATVIKDKLKADGSGAYEGNLFRATVSESLRCTLNMEAVREKLSPQFIAANTTKTPVVTVKVVARNNEGLKAAA